MKTLLIIRHAKSSWALIGQSDTDRPLNNRGNKDAPEIANRLLNKNIPIDLFLSSTAVRAKETCIHFSKAFKAKNNNIQFTDDLYHASSKKIFDVIASINNEFNCAAVFTHNPGITDFVNELSTAVKIDNMPTCGVFAVEASIEKWKDFEQCDKRFVLFDYPKNI